MGRMKDRVIEICEMYQSGLTLEFIADYTGERMESILYILETYYGGGVVAAETIH